MSTSARSAPRSSAAGGSSTSRRRPRRVVFCGEFAVGAQVAIEDGAVKIVSEGKMGKFVEHVEQITFSGKIARQEGRKVLFVTERCVFKLVREGLLLTEIAPGVDLEKDVLGQMGFRPMVAPDLKLMDARLFQDRPMGIACGCDSST